MASRPSSRSNSRKAGRVARHLGEIAVAAPQVIAHRVARMAAAGAQPSARDRREFSRMGSEKAEAFAASWIAMGTQAMLAQQAFASAWLRAASAPWQAAFAPSAMQAALHGAALEVLGAGLVPIRKTAVANAKRLGRRRR